MLLDPEPRSYRPTHLPSARKSRQAVQQRSRCCGIDAGQLLAGSRQQLGREGAQGRQLSAWAWLVGQPRYCLVSQAAESTGHVYDIEAAGVTVVHLHKPPTCTATHTDYNPRDFKRSQEGHTKSRGPHDAGPSLCCDVCHHCWSAAGCVMQHKEWHHTTNLPWLQVSARSGH